MKPKLALILSICGLVIFGALTVLALMWGTGNPSPIFDTTHDFDPFIDTIRAFVSFNNRHGSMNMLISFAFAVLTVISYTRLKSEKK